MRLRGAIYGCGMISEFHLRGWLRIPEVEIVALANRTLERAEARRAEFVPGARVYGDLDAMLAAERLDFIDILTTPELHAAHCRAALARGLHVICQKPLCHTLEEARALVRDAEGSPRLLAVHENHRYRPWFQLVRERFRGGFFGKVRFAHFQHLAASEPPEEYKNRSSTGVFLEYGTHLVDMMRSLFGEPRRVFAREHRLNPKVRGESLVHAAYEYPELTAVIDVGWKCGALTQASLILAGDQGEAYWEGSLTRGGEGRLRLTRGAEVVLDERRDPYRDYVESFYLLEREFTLAMLGRGSLVQTGRENLRTLVASFAAYDSAAKGEPVQVQPL